MTDDLRQPALCAIVLALMTGPGARGEIVRVDLGTQASPVRKGFLRVTHGTTFGKTTQVGWVKTSGLISNDMPLSREWKHNESRGRSYPAAIYTTDLRQDHVGGQGQAVLRVRAKDGPYRVWLLCGTPGGNRDQVWNVCVRSGQESAEATFVGPHTARVLELRVTARGGVVDLVFSSKSRWMANAMLVVPEAAWEKAKRTDIAKIEQEVFLLPDDVLEKWKHTPHKEKTPPPTPTEAETQRGFILYHRPYLSPVWPNTAPRREECDPTLRAFASSDEYEPLTFTLLPLKDFKRVSVDVGDLRTSDGQTIRHDDIDVRYVRYMHVRPNYSLFGTYYRAPDVLMPFRAPRPLVTGENFRVWLTVYVDAFAADGIYRGQAAVSVDGKQAAVVPIVFRVLPIKLQKDQSIVYGIYYRHPYDGMRRAPDAFSRRWWRRKAELEFADMADHGNNAFVSGIGARLAADGKWIVDFETLGKRIDLARRYGFDKPIICHIPTGSVYYRHMKAGMGSHLRLLKMPPKAFFDEMTEMVRAIEDGRRRRHWPELLYYPIDEPSRSDVSIRFMTELMKAIKRVPGVRTYVTADPAHETFAPMKPYVDVWCCQPFSLSRETILADMKKRGVAYWCYPNHVAGENDHTPVAGARMTYGFGFWRSGFRALTPWIYQSDKSDPWNYLDGSYMDFFNRTDDDASPIPVMMWEAYREGIDDGRYITTLRRWIERARKAGLVGPTKQAEADLKFVWDSIDVQEKYKYDDLWEPEAFDVYRWVIARQIMNLQQVLTQGG